MGGDKQPSTTSPGWLCVAAEILVAVWDFSRHFQGAGQQIPAQLGGPAH